MDNMITLNKFGDKSNKVCLELYGLSTDEKPIEKFNNMSIKNGSTLYTMDDKKVYVYSEEDGTWYEA